MVDFIVGFIVSVAANVVSYCVNRWLDRHNKGQ